MKARSQPPAPYWQRETVDSLDQIEAYDNMYHLETIGYSTQENLPIKAVKISDNADVKEDEARLLFLGQCHAEEVLGVEAVIELIYFLMFLLLILLL